MRRPEVKLDLSNAEEVYEYYSNKTPNERFLKGFHAACAALVHPKTSFALQTENTIDVHLRKNKPLLFAISHASWLDPVHAAAVLRKEEVFRPTIGKINIPAKGPIFGWPVVSSVVSAGGGIPVYRKQDLEKAGTFNDKANEYRRELGSRLIGLTTERLDQGFHIAYFPEGTRRDKASSKIQTIRRGLGETACNAAQPEDTLIVCMGIDYGENGRQLARPNIGINTIQRMAATPTEVSDQVASSLQSAMDLAIINRDITR